MMAYSEVNKRKIAKNTAFLYMRMFFTMFISFYTSRVILEVLGVEDFGIYNVVGGITTAIVFFTGSLTNVTQRYYNLGLGQEDKTLTSCYFNQFLLIFFILALLVLIIGEALASWIVNILLSIPEPRREAAAWVYQFSLLALILSLVQIPYQSAVIAHEKMDTFAYVSLFESISRLAILYILQALQGDKLVVYGGLYFLICLSSFLVYAFYSHAKFEECFYRFYFSKPLAKEMLKFVSYNMYGCFAFSMCQQGVNVLLNMFFGPAVNAARALSLQVFQGVFRFSDNILTAVRPPIIKLYSQGNRRQMVSLSISATRYCLFLNALLVIPIIVNVDFILSVWLKKVPAYTTVFIIIVLIESNFNIANNMLTVLVNATGDLKRNQFYGRTFTLLALPISYVALLWMKSPAIPMLIILLSTFFYWLNNVRDAHIQVRLGYTDYFKQIIFPTAVLYACLSPLSYAVKSCMAEGWLNLIATTVVCTVLGLSVIYGLLLNTTERSFVRDKIQIALKKT